MASGNVERWPEPLLDAVVKNNNNMSKHPARGDPQAKEQTIYGGLQVRPRHDRSHGNMKFRKLFSRDADVSGLIKRPKKSKKGSYFLLLVI